MAIQLYPYCPALARMRYRPHLVERQGLVSKALELLKTNPAVVITGSDHEEFENNCVRGKTTLAGELLQKVREGGQSALWVNLQAKVWLAERDRDLATKFSARDFQFFESEPTRRLRARTAEVCFIDEAQLGFLSPEEKYSARVKYNNRYMFGFLKELAKLANQGMKFVFISSAHPLNPMLLGNRGSYEMINFFTAPVIELDCNEPTPPEWLMTDFELMYFSKK